MAVQAATKKKKPTITKLLDGDDLYCKGIASTGKQLFLCDSQKIYRWTGTKLLPVAKDQTGLNGLCSRGNELWACGYGYVLSSTDAKTFRKTVLIKDEKTSESQPQLTDIAVDADNVVWTVGYKGGVLFSRDGKKFTTLEPIDDIMAESCVASPFGMLILKNNGRLQIAMPDKGVSNTPLRSKKLTLYSACVTSSGAVVAVGSGNWKGVAFRTTDGKTFEPSTVAESTQMFDIVAMPDGRLIAGGNEDILFISYDDGRSFERLAHKHAGPKREIRELCIHDGSVYATGPFQHLLQIT